MISKLSIVLCKTTEFYCARLHESSRKANLVNAVPRSAQIVDFAFAFVKASSLKSLGIIKTAEICSEKNSADFKEIFTIKHIGKIIKEQIFTGLLIIFTII